MEVIVNIKGFKEKAGLELPVRKQSFPFSIFPFPRWQPLTPMDSERAIRDSHPRWKKIAAAPPLALPRSLLRMSAVAGDGGKVFDQCNRLRRQAAQKAPASLVRRGLA